MTSLSLKNPREFIRDAELPPLTRGRARLNPEAPPLFDMAKDEAAVVGSDVVSFVTGVTPERREAILNSSLLAQLVAEKKVQDPSRTADWYKEYYAVLSNIGWVTQYKDFAEYRKTTGAFEAHEAVIAVATTVLGAGTTALALVKTTLNSLKSMDKNSSWITLFNRESQRARTARFQVTLAEQKASDHFLVTLMAFSLEATRKVTQVLFFKVKQNEATLKHYSGGITINTGVLDSVSGALKSKLANHANDYIAKLPDLN